MQMRFSETQKLSPPLAFTILDNVSQILSCWTEELDFLYANKAWHSHFALPKASNIIDSQAALYPIKQNSDQPAFDLLRKYSQKAMQKGECLFPFVFFDLNGAKLATNVTFTKLDYEGKTCLLMQVFPFTPSNTFTLPADENIDENSWMRSITNSTLISSTLWNENLDIIDCSDFRLKFLGTNKETFLNNYFDFCPEYQADGQSTLEAAKKYKTLALKDGYCTFDWTYTKHDGTSFTTKTFLLRTIYRSKNYFISFSLDSIANHDIFTSSIMANYDRMKLLLKHLPVGVDLWDKNFKLYDCNEATLHLFGVKDKQEYIEKFESFSPEFQPCGTRSKDLVGQHLQKVFEKGHTSFEWLHIDKEGKDLPLEINVIRTKNDKNEDIAIVYYTDLREVKKNIQKIKNDEQRLSDILNSAPYAITTWGKDLKPVDCNDATLELFGFESREDFLQNYFKMLPATQKSGRITSDVFQEVFKTVLEKGYAFGKGELYNALTDTYISAEVTLKTLYIDGVERIIIYLTDLSVQYKLLKEIQENHQELSKARDLAEKSSKVKSEFLANMSHEIRTPMNGILGLLHLLLFTNLQKQQKSYVDKILYSAESLLRIINDILDFSKIEAGKLEMESVSFTLEEIREELYTLFSTKFEEKRIRGDIFHENILDTKLIGDPLRLKQVFLNLIGNAIKFTEKGSVRVAIDSITQGAGSQLTYVFSVKDSGIGLSKEQCSRIFSAFSQADTSTTRKYGGTGLGLIISKRIVEMMQGKIWVESEVGQGSTFYFSATFDVDTQQTSILSEEKIDIDIEPTLKGHILLVEDNDINQLIAMELLMTKGHKVDVACNGQEAIDMLNKNQYDLVLMDIQMPVMDGLTATQKIRENKTFANLPIIAMSAHAMKGDKEISLSHGMNDHLSKPIDPQNLYACINVWLKKKT